MRRISLTRRFEQMQVKTCIASQFAYLSSRDPQDAGREYLGSVVHHQHRTRWLHRMGLRREVDRAKHPKLSLFQLGLRYINRLLHLGKSQMFGSSLR